MKKNIYSGHYAKYNTEENPAKITRPKNRFTGSYDRYNSEPATETTIQEKETFSPQQKKILGETLEELKNKIVGAITGTVKKNESSEITAAANEFQRLQNENLKQINENPALASAFFGAGLRPVF